MTSNDAINLMISINDVFNNINMMEINKKTILSIFKIIEIQYSIISDNNLTPRNISENIIIKKMNQIINAIDNYQLNNNEIIKVNDDELIKVSNNEIIKVDDDGFTKVDTKRKSKKK
jgi:hypothetical protein